MSSQHIEDKYKRLCKAGNVKWKKYLRKEEQIKFLQELQTASRRRNSQKNMRHFIWTKFFPMLTWNEFCILFRGKKLKSKRMTTLSNKLFDKKIRGGCIFTLLAGVVSSIAAAAASTASTIAATAGAVGTAIASSSVASSVVTGVVGGMATVAGEKLVEEALK